jgi:Transmembrane family 220, helix
MLRLLNLVLCLVMIVFAALQYNDRDMLLWVVYYIVPAAWAFVAAFRHRLFQSVQWLGWLWACVAAWVGLVWYYWPKMPNFWHAAVWTQQVTAREGMGLMIALAVLLVAVFTAYKKR